MKKVTLYSLLFVVLDLVLKLIISFNMNLYSSIKIVPGFFDITYVKNIGAAFSILEGSRIIFIVIAIIAIFVIYKFFIINQKLDKWDILNYSMLLGGIVGNLIDRIIYGYVIDYLSFNIFGYNFPVFNLADTFIVVSVILIIIKSIKESVCKKK